jgi:hypothetical protein
VDDDRVVVTVDVGVDSIEALEDLPDCLIETLGERDTCAVMSTCIQRIQLHIGRTKCNN